ncbi:uncharacterized protein LOC127855324 isoform X1 [Dreissena polymorpha]|uniref:uncharacterized protein LOC127855324 isoform X1 n=1 Tax=Dreissena polymorpha TaxID=45954 RepID=UPI00226412FD|nr:uncharacterized protein LOC127855324 isoform X1 [Dreissena polymorpha]
MESFKAVLGLVTCIVAVSLVHGASVSVSRNITTKPTPEPPSSGPRVDITLECIGSSSDLSYYIKNQVNWDFKDSNGVVHPITQSFYAATGATASYADSNFKAGRFEFKYETNKMTGFYQFILLIKGVKYSDDGEYTCTLIAENKTVADKKTLKVTVVHPVDSVMLTLYDSMNNNKLYTSNAPVTDSTEAIPIKPGSFRVECQAKGSNPAPKVDIRFDGASIAMSDTGDKSVVSGRPSYSKTLSVTQDVAAKDMDQLFSCDANIAGNHYVTKVASIKVRAIIDTPDFLCDNLTRSVGDNHVEVKCILLSESELACDKVTWEIAEENFVMHVDDRHQDPERKYGILELTCTPINSTSLSTSLIVHQAADPHFATVFYVIYDGGPKDFKHAVIINKQETSSATLLAPLTFLATIIMAAVSKLL